jgi:hypothetical protein
MAIKNLICLGIGFSPGSVKYIPTLGFIASDFVTPTGTRVDYTAFGVAGIDFRAAGEQFDYVAAGAAGIDFTPRRTGQPDFRAAGKQFDYTGREV